MDNTQDAQSITPEFVNFGEALKMLKEGLKVSRRGWNGIDMFIFLEQARDYKESELLPHLVIKTVNNAYIPWLASQADLLVEDWFIYGKV